MVVFSNLILRLPKTIWTKNRFASWNVLFSKSVNEFLAFRRYDILKDNGRISHKQAVEKAYQEYDIFNKTQPIESDFDKIVKGLEKKI